MNLAFQPINDADWPSEIEDMLSGFAGGLNVYRTMAHHPALLKAWSDLREHVVNQTSLGAELSEVVILRTGVRLEASYEWHQHIVRGRKSGLSDERIARLNGPLGQITGQDTLLVNAVDQLFDQRELSPEVLKGLLAEVGKHGVMDLIATVGFYTTLGFILKSFDTPLDADIAAELRAAPFLSDSI